MLPGMDRRKTGAGVDRSEVFKMEKSFNTWFRDPKLVLYNKFYEPDQEISQYMRENSQFLGIFFGASKSRATKHFTTYLNKYYRYIVQRDEPFDIIFVSMDDDEADCEFFVCACMEEWLVIPWTNQNLRRNVRNLYGILGIPALVIVCNDENGTVVSHDAKMDLMQCGYFALMEWRSQYKVVLQEQKEAEKAAKERKSKAIPALPSLDKKEEKAEEKKDEKKE